MKPIPSPTIIRALPRSLRLTAVLSSLGFAGLLYDADYEEGSTGDGGSLYEGIEKCCSYSAKTSTEVSRLGTTSIRFESHYTDPEVSGCRGRSEVHLKALDQFKTYWYAWSYFKPTSQCSDPVGEEVGQHHSRPDAGDEWTEPPIRNYIIGDNMAIEVNATSVLHHTNGSYEFKKTLANVKITKGVWYDFIWQINWDYRKPANGGTGFIKLWVQVDGKGYDQIVDYTGQTGYNNPTSSFLKYGMYPHGWRNHAATKGC